MSHPPSWQLDTQNRDFKALGMINLHNLSDKDLHRLEKAFERFGGQHDIEEVLQSLESSSDNR